MAVSSDTVDEVLCSLAQETRVFQDAGRVEVPAVALSDGVTAGTKGGLRKHLAVVASGMLGLGGRGEGT